MIKRPEVAALRLADILIDIRRLDKNKAGFQATEDIRIHDEFTETVRVKDGVCGLAVKSPLIPQANHLLSQDLNRRPIL